MKTMSLYAYQPTGHGEQSFFVMAETEAEARAAVDAYIAARPSPWLNSSGWGTDYYKLTVAAQGIVVENDND